MSFQVRELTRQELSYTKEDNRYGFKLLELKNRDATSRMIVQQVENVIREFQGDCKRGTRSPQAPESAEIAFGLGAVWGFQLVREFEWTWACLVANGIENYVVVPPDRSLFIAPAPFVKQCFDQPDTVCNIAFVFDLIESGKLSGFPENGFANVMASVQQQNTSEAAEQDAPQVTP